MTKLELVATLAWQKHINVWQSGVTPTDLIQEAVAFVELTEKLMAPQPRQCQSLQPFNGEEFRGVCDLPAGHTGKHMDGGFIW